MFKMDFALGSFLAGVVLTLVLLALDKAEKLKGPWPLVLLVPAVMLTLPLVFSLPVIANSQGTTRAFRILAAIFVVGVIYSVLAAWISTPDAAPPVPSPAPVQAKPKFKATPVRPYPGFIKLNANILERSITVGPDSLVPVVIAFENVPDAGQSFAETQTVSAFVSYRAPDNPNLEFSRATQGCWLYHPVADVAFPFRTPQYLILGGWFTEPLTNEFRIFEYSPNLRRPILQDMKLGSPLPVLVTVVLTPTGHPEVSQEYKFLLILRQRGSAVDFDIKSVADVQTTAQPQTPHAPLASPPLGKSDPDFTGEVHKVQVFDKKNEIYMHFWVTLRNAGAPMPIARWGLKLNIPNKGKFGIIESSHPTTDPILREGSRMVKQPYSSQDLAERRSPITAQDPGVGILSFVLKGLTYNDIRPQGVMHQIVFQDAEGRDWSFPDGGIGEERMDDEFLHIKGFKEQVMPQSAQPTKRRRARKK